MSIYHLHKLSPGSKGKTVRCSRTAILVSCSVTYFMNTFQDSSGSIFSAILTCCSTALVNTHAKSLFKHYLERSSFFLSSCIINGGKTFFLILNVPYTFLMVMFSSHTLLSSWFFSPSVSSLPTST